MTTEQIEQHVLQKCGAEPLSLHLAHGRVRYMVSRDDHRRRLLLHDRRGGCYCTADDSPAWHMAMEDADALQVWEAINGWVINGEVLTRSALLDIPG